VAVSAITLAAFRRARSRLPGDRHLLLVAEENGSVAGVAMGFAPSGPDVTVRILGIAVGPAQNET
jgi:hypothetical protein